MTSKFTNSLSLWLYQKIGLEIKTNRKKNSFTQQELADKVSLNRTSIAKMEAGKQRFSLDTLYILANAMNIEPIKLLPELSQFKPKKNVSDIFTEAKSSEKLSKDELESLINAMK